LISRQTPFDKIILLIQQKDFLPEEFVYRLPKRWRRVGTVGILELHPEILPWKEQIGKSYLEILTEFTTIIRKAGTTTTTIRTPAFELLAGQPDTVTLHKELGSKFWVDALRLTFSSGNHTERQRLINIVEEGEKVIDMFACVGNLSIPVSVHHPESKVIGIEINQYAYSFLEKNVKENQLESRYKAIMGDNQEKTPENYADRVLMGYFELSRKQLEVAIASLKQEKGGTIHTHGLTTEKQPFDWRDQIKSIIAKKYPDFRIETAKKRIIKSVAPGVNHFVDDIIISNHK
jgi:tRNA wybutosine-synthesizing protein 2